jgi:hypothetical protein
MEFGPISFGIRRRAWGASILWSVPIGGHGRKGISTNLHFTFTVACKVRPKQEPFCRTASRALGPLFHRTER